MAPAFEQLALLLTFIAIGFLLGKSGAADRSHAKLLSVLCVNLFLPSTIFNSFSKSFTVRNLSSYYQLILGSLAILLMLIPIAILLSRRLTKDDYQRKVLFYSLTVPNYGYVGYAVAEALFGADGLLSLILFSVPVSLFTYTVGFSLLTKRQLSFKKLFNSVNIAIILGVLAGLLEVKLPHAVSLILSKSAGCMAPISMLLTGLAISEFDLRRLPFRLSTVIVCLMRLLVIPVAVALALRPVGNELLRRMAVLMYAMPCGLNTIVFPKLVGEDCSTGATLALLSNVLAVITIPLCLSLL